jgi:hypothetical protein
MVGTITKETKREGQGKTKLKYAQPTRTKRGKKLVPFMVGSYLTHGPSNVKLEKL